MSSKERSPLNSSERRFEIAVSDACTYLNTIADNSIDLVLSDAPYGVLDEDWDRNGSETLIKTLPGIVRVLKNESFGVIFCNHWHLTPIRQALFELSVGHSDVVIWEKQASNSTSNIEAAIRFRKAPIIRFSQPLKSVYRHTTATRYRKHELEHSNFHPCRKSLPLIREILVDHSIPEDLVLDPFLGSGTTAIACMLESRRFRGCDICEEYVESAISNLRNAKSYMTK